MTFAHPFAPLLGLLAIAVAVLYWLRLRLRREPVATGMFWEKALGEDRVRSRWQRWRHPVSLAVQLLLLALVVLALAGPQIPRPRHTVLIFDNSPGMNAADVQPNRVCAAKEAAIRLVEGLREDDQMAVYCTAPAPTLLTALTADHDVLRKAIDSVAVANADMPVKDSVECAQKILQASPAAEGRVVVLAGGLDGATELASAGVEVLRVGTPTGNAAICRLEARRPGPHPRQCQVFVEVRNLSDQPAECRLTASLNDKPVVGESLRLAADDRWAKVFDVEAAAGGRLTARLDPADAYPADNEATIELPALVVHEVAVAADASAYLQSTLRTCARIRVVDAGERHDEGKGDLKSPLRIVEGQTPERLPAGALLVLNPTTSCDWWNLAGPVSDPMIARQAENSPLLAGVRMADVYLPEARSLELAEGVRSKAQPLFWTADNTPLAYAIDRPQGRVVVVCGDLGASSLAGRPALTSLLVNAFVWLSGANVPLASSSAANTSTPIDLRVPANVGVDAAAVGAERPWPAAWLYPAVLAFVLFVAEWCLYQRRWIS